MAKLPAVVLPNVDTSIQVWEYAELLEDSTRRLTFQETQALPAPLAFRSTAGRSTQLGFSASDYWLRFRLRTSDSSVKPRMWVLHLPYFFANRLTLFLTDETTGSVVERNTGDGTPMALWDMPYQEGAFRLNLLPGRTYTVLLRLSGNNSKSFIPVVSEILQYNQFAQWSAYLLALYNGMLIFAVILQLIFFGFTNERNFIYYAIYLLSFEFVLLQNGNGLPGEIYFWPENEWLNKNGITLSSALCSTCILLFYSNGLKLKQHSSWLAPIFQGAALVMILLTIGVLTGQVGINATQYVVSLGLLCLCLALVACVVSLVNGFRPARYYLLATVSFLAGMIVLALWHNGLVPINYLTTYSVPIGSLSEIVFFTLALADDYQLSHQQEQKVQQQLIDTLQTQNEHISRALLQGQTLERKRVAADLHDNLGSTLSSLRWSLEAIDTTKLTQPEQSVYATLSQQLNQAYNDVRLLSHNLLPDELAQKGLAFALTMLIDKLNRNTPVQFQLSIAQPFQRLSMQTEFELYSICLELLNNTLKHANATEAYLIMNQSPGKLGLIIGDNGVGLNGQRKNGQGLQNVTARVAALGGSWTVGSEQGEGTQNQITVPLNAMHF
ncbi:7TM diverse intracellular signaling domain-containing protein [Spirosoma sp. KNUC1025]|uniref:sensor histidine kinase n=1 Tax=Spirosoma sp. KNUC1025 TaxID=2894082 RepID=UPI0038662CD6|nr:histidine kinase [Spirosoma sp. KNUC1025]